MSGEPTSLLIADDQALIRDALEALLRPVPDLMVIGVAANGFQAVSESRRLRPDVILMDVRMPGLSGNEATARIRASGEAHRPHVLILSTFEEPDVIRACAAAGADGFVGKSVSAESLIAAIRAVMRGEHPMSARARAVLAGEKQDERSASLAGLTAREVQIAKLIARGETNEVIGERLDISEATVKTHVRNIMSKTSMHSRAQLIVHLLRIGRFGG